MEIAGVLVPALVVLVLAILFGVALGIMGSGFYAGRRLEEALSALDPDGAIAQQLTKERGGYVNEVVDLIAETKKVHTGAAKVIGKLEDLAKTINGDIDNPDTFKILRELKLSVDRDHGALQDLVARYRP